MSTPNLELPTSPSGPSNISVAFNDAMQRIDAVVQLIAQDNTLNDPPVTVSGDEGKRWIVADSPTGDWGTHAYQIAVCTAPGLWKFLAPLDGWRCRVLTDGLYYSFNAGAWTPDSGVSAAFGDLSGSPEDNVALKAALDAKAGTDDLTGLATELFVKNAVGTLASLQEKTANFTVDATCAGGEVRFTSATDVTFYIDKQAVVDTPDRMWCFFSQGGVGTVTAAIVAGSGVILRTPNGKTTSGLGDARGLQHISGDEWRVW